MSSHNFALGNPEEQDLLEKYGNVYREYMNRTPKWIGIPKSKQRTNKEETK